MSVIVGIDLGTTNSLVAIADAHGPRVLLAGDEDASALVPSVVRYEADEAGGVRTVVGADARERAVEFPTSTISSVKRLMGRSLAEASGELGYLSYAVVEGSHGQCRVSVPVGGGSVTVSPQEVSAEILRALKARAEAALGEAVEKAVVTVPAYFDDAQRQATRDAGRLAGLEVVRIVNEPTAAALAYGLGLAGDARERTVAVYDLGGGTFDVSILRLTPATGDNPTSFFEVLATAGDTRLGGDDVDNLLVDLFFREMRAQLGLRVERVAELAPATRRALRRFAEGVKHRLSEAETASVRIEAGEGLMYERTIGRDEFEALITPWVDRSLEACRRALRDAQRAMGGEGARVDAVVLVGGSTRVPLVRAKVGELFGLEPYTALDPDRVVALGAAVQASILAGERKGALLLDVIPLSLGIETVGGAVAKLIVRNSQVPARATEMFSTSVDGQTSIKIHVLQGEREMVEDCRSLGVFDLKGLPPMPAGVPQVEVEFLVDANGVLSVRAHERRSGKRAGIQVVPNHGLTRDEVDRIEAESFKHAKEDMTRHRVVDLIANASLDVKWITERFDKFKSELEPEYAKDLDARLAGVRSFIDRARADWQSVDANAFANAKDELDRASVRLQEVSIAASLRGEGNRQ